MPVSHTFESPLAVIGIGACLAGNAVRYDGSGKSPNPHVIALYNNFHIRPFCPEMGVGMGVPRPPIQLVGDEQTVRVLDVATHSRDYTEDIAAYADKVLALAPEICGYILVKSSPSCGYGRVKRFSGKGYLLAFDQQGVFAAALERADPLLPLEDDGRLNDPALRDSFLTRACAYHDWKLLRAGGLCTEKLNTFYDNYKYLVMAHDVSSYKSLASMLENAEERPLETLAAEFIGAFMRALKQRATRRSHSNVLLLLSGCLKRDISDDERQRLKALIDQYRTGKVPLQVPVTLLRQHFADNLSGYLDRQVFLDSYPDIQGEASSQHRL